MAFKRIAVICLFVASLSICSAWAQYSATGTQSMTDLSSSTCTTSSCFTWVDKLAGGGTLHSYFPFQVGSDGYVATTQSGSDYYEMKFQSGSAAATWSNVPGLGLTGATFNAIAPQNSTNIFALISDNVVCGSIHNLPAYAVYQANASKTGWTRFSPNGCLDSLHVAADGTLTGAINENVGGTIYEAFYWRPGDASWTQVPGAVWGEVVPQSRFTGYGVQTTTYLYKIDFTNNTFTFLSPGSARATINSISVGRDGELFVVGTNGPQPSIFYQNMDREPIGSWHQLYNSASSPFVTAANLAMAFTNGYGQRTCPRGLNGWCVPAHLNMFTPYVSGTLAGNYTTWCNNHPGGCPAGSMHSITYQLSYPSGGGGIQGSAGPATPQTQLSAPSFAFANPVGCDIYFGNPQDPNCIPTQVATATCSIMGPLDTTTPPLPCTDPLPDEVKIPHGFLPGETVQVWVDSQYNSGQYSAIKAAFNVWKPYTGVTWTFQQSPNPPIYDGSTAHYWVSYINDRYALLWGAATQECVSNSEPVFYCNDHSTKLIDAWTAFNIDNPYNHGTTISNAQIESVMIHEIGHTFWLGDVQASVGFFSCATTNQAVESSQMVQDVPPNGTNCHYQSSPPLFLTACDLKWYYHWRYIFAGV